MSADAGRAAVVLMAAAAIWWFAQPLATLWHGSAAAIVGLRLCAATLILALVIQYGAAIIATRISGYDAAVRLQRVVGICVLMATAAYLAERVPISQAIGLSLKQADFLGVFIGGLIVWRVVEIKERFRARDEDI